MPTSPGPQALRDQKAALGREIRNLIESNTSAEAYAKVAVQVDALTAQAFALDNSLRSMEAALRVIEDAPEQARDLSARNHRSTDENERDFRAARSAYVNALRHGSNSPRLTDAERALVSPDSPANFQRSRLFNVGTGVGSGATLIPTIVMPSVIAKMVAFGGVRLVARALATANGDPLQWGTYDPTTLQAAVVAEATAPGAGDIVFGSTLIGAYQYATPIIPVSGQVLMDAAVDVEAIVIDTLAMAMARGQNNDFTNGAGTAGPQGVVTAATLGKTGLVGQTTSIIYDDLVDMEHAVDPAYRISPNTAFMFHDNTLKIIKKLKDGIGRPLWMPGDAATFDSGKSNPDTILNRRYVINQQMPQMAANAKSILFGDFSRYMIRDVLDFLLMRFTDSAYASKFQIGFMGWARADGRMIDAAGSGSIRYYANSAT